MEVGRAATSNRRKHLARGVVVPLLTPLSPDEELDEGGLRRLVRHCISGGAAMLLALGTTGEAAQLTEAVRDAALRVVLDENAGAVPVVAGCSDTGTRRTLRRIEAAARAGADYALVCPPFYFVADGPGAIPRYYRSLAAGSPLPLVLYNIPQFCGYALRPESIAELAKVAGIVGVKDSSGAEGAVDDIVRAVDDDRFAVYQGWETQSAQGLREGAWGVVPSGANIVPGLYVQLCEAATAGRWDEAERLQSALARLSALYDFASVFAVTKAALRISGICEGAAVTSPHAGAESVDENALAEVLDHLRQ